jgi:hypothetical protein
MEKRKKEKEVDSELSELFSWGHIYSWKKEPVKRK